ncbi:DUF5519 family protein [Gallaecimonas kandeliae]|uniref:luciferase domain-containing protein n=1 Tax=Gallaecimonas kandeliae TaxID=3029055 RepID=UPI002648996F|nr:luciferase family protein [Gallaecimonas kandeliae]WKE64045.1 DUF5519 family protein [Gallaecimonas kandeliae]
MNALKAELIALLEQIPGVKRIPYPDRDDGFCGLGFRGKEIGHFHSGNELDLKLGRRLIQQQGLRHPADSTVHPKRSPNSQYIELRFHQRQELGEIARLVTLLVGELRR